MAVFAALLLLCCCAGAYGDSIPLPPSLGDVWAQYTAESFRLGGASTWADVSGNGRHATVSGGGLVLATDGVASAGVVRNPNAHFSFVAGGSGDGVAFAQLPPAPLTLCAVTRFLPSGSAQRRVLQASGADVAHGHLDGTAGTIRYAGVSLVTSQPATVASNTAWVASCVRSGGADAWVNGAFLPAPPLPSVALGAPVVNAAGGAFNASQGSDAWAVAELLVWPRALSDEEMEWLDDSYLDARYGLPTAAPCYSTCRTGTYFAQRADYPSTCTPCPGGAWSNNATVCYSYVNNPPGPMSQACYTPAFADAFVSAVQYGPTFKQAIDVIALPGGRLAVADQKAMVVMDATSGALISNTTDSTVGSQNFIAIAANANSIFVGKWSGVVLTYAINGTFLSVSSALPNNGQPLSLAADNAGNVFIGQDYIGDGFVVQYANGSVVAFTSLRLGFNFTFRASRVALSPDGATLYVADNQCSTGRVIWQFNTATWAATLLVGRDPRTATGTPSRWFVDGAGSAAAFGYIYSMRLVGSSLYFSEYSSLLIRAMSTIDGSVSTVLTYGDWQDSNAMGVNAFAVASPLQMYVVKGWYGAVRTRLWSLTVTLPPPSPPLPPPSPPHPPPPAASPAAACWDVAHRFAAVPADWRGLYPDTGAAAPPWSAVALRAPTDALLSVNDYGFVHPLLGTGSVPLPGGELYDTARDAWMLEGTTGLGVLLPSSNETMGSAQRGMSLAVWFLASNSWSAINEGHNMLLAASTAGGVSLRLVFAVGLANDPRMSLKVARMPTPGAHTSSTSSDYANSDRDFGPAPSAANPGGNATWPVRLGVTWQHAVVTFSGNGTLRALYWNGLKQGGNWVAPPSLGQLPFGPLVSMSLGYDGGIIGQHKGDGTYCGPSPPWRFLSGLQGGVADVQTYNYALSDAQAAALYVASAAACAPAPPPISPPLPPGVFAPPPSPPSPPASPPGDDVMFTLCAEGVSAASFANTTVAAELAAGVAAYFAANGAAFAAGDVSLLRAAVGCAAPAAARRSLAAAASPLAGLDLLAASPSAAATAAAGAALRALAQPTSAAAHVLVAALQAAGLRSLTSVWTAPVVVNGTLGAAVAAAGANAGQPTPPSPPPRPPYPPVANAPPGAKGGAGGARNRPKVAAPDSAGAAVGYAIAAIVVLWVPVHMLFHALTAAHVRRTCVTFAVALQCTPDASIADVHASFAERRRSSARISRASSTGTPGGPAGGGGHETEVEGAEAYVLQGRRFAAPGLAAAASAFFGGRAAAAAASGRAAATVRPLLRSPLLAALGGHKGQEATALAMRSKPKGLWKRLKRALHAELAWHKRAWHHAARGIKRCLTPRFSAEARAAGHGAGHAFRSVPADEWLGLEAAPPTAALFEVSVDFGWRGRVAASKFRACLRDGAQLRSLEADFASTVAAAECAVTTAEPPHPPPLGVRHAGLSLVALLDDEPHARLDARLSRHLGVAEEGKSGLGLSADVAERLATLLRLCLKRRSSDEKAAQPPSPSQAGATCATSLAAAGEAGPARRDSAALAAADVPGDDAHAEVPARDSEAKAPATTAAEAGLPVQVTHDVGAPAAELAPAEAPAQEEADAVAPAVAVNVPAQEEAAAVEEPAAPAEAVQAAPPAPAPAASARPTSAQAQRGRGGARGGRRGGGRGGR